MEWTQAITIIFSTFSITTAMMLFVIREIRQTSRDISAEYRDFHARLCRLEERYAEVKYTCDKNNLILKKGNK